CPMGWIVSFVGQKGGTGKSGLCQALGVEAAKNGASVLIADLDEAQRTSFEWGEARALNNIEPPVKVVLESRLKVLTLADQCELLAVDAPG
ncbi:AAA family ATPase, partial [Acinetobacter baumannii]